MRLAHVEAHFENEFDDVCASSYDVFKRLIHFSSISKDDPTWRLVKNEKKAQEFHEKRWEDDCKGRDSLIDLLLLVIKHSFASWALFTLQFPVGSSSSSLLVFSNLLNEIGKILVMQSLIFSFHVKDNMLLCYYLLMKLRLFFLFFLSFTSTFIILGLLGCASTNIFSLYRFSILCGFHQVRCLNDLY